MQKAPEAIIPHLPDAIAFEKQRFSARPGGCLLYTSDAADERSSVDLGGRRIIKKKKNDKAQKARNNP